MYGLSIWWPTWPWRIWGHFMFHSSVKMAECLKEGLWLAFIFFPFKFCFWIKCEFPMPISLSFFSHCCCHLKWLPHNLFLLTSCICCSSWPTSTYPGPTWIFFEVHTPSIGYTVPHTHAQGEFFHGRGPVLALPALPSAELPTREKQ